MTVTVSPALAAYMEKRRRHNLSVEVASSDRSDFEVTELFVRLVTDDLAEYLVSKKRYRKVQGPLGLVLLPPYRLHYDEELRFDVRKTWFIHSVTVEGVRL